MIAQITVTRQTSEASPQPENIGKIPLANWFSQAAVGLKALGYSDKGRLHGLHQTRYRISPAIP